MMSNSVYSINSSEPPGDMAVVASKCLNEYIRGNTYSVSPWCAECPGNSILKAKSLKELYIFTSLIL